MPPFGQEGSPLTNLVFSRVSLLPPQGKGRIENLDRDWSLMTKITFRGGGGGGGGRVELNKENHESWTSSSSAQWQKCF